jgi:hypothetical protein
MNTPSINIRHGKLLNITGRPVRTGCITFLPADVELAGSDAQYSQPLKDYVSKKSPKARSTIQSNVDAPWALGRILYLFGGHLLSDLKEFGSELNHSLFCQSFMAVLHDDDNLSIPFVCMDYFCESHLRFSSDQSLSATTKDKIAESFWGLLLSDSAELEDYECSLLHSKIGSGQIRFGVADGEPFLFDLDG